MIASPLKLLLLDLSLGYQALLSCPAIHAKVCSLKSSGQFVHNHNIVVAKEKYAVKTSVEAHAHRIRSFIDHNVEASAEDNCIVGDRI